MQFWRVIWSSPSYVRGHTGKSAVLPFVPAVICRELKISNRILSLLPTSRFFLLKFVSEIFDFSLFQFTALLCSAVSAFAPATPAARQFVAKPLAATDAVLDTEVDTIGNNIAVKDLLASIEEKKLLSQVAKSGLLSKAQAAGISLSKLETLLAFAADQPELLILVEASGPEILPLLPTVIDLAPAALPLLSLAVGIPPVTLQAAGLASLVAAAGIVSVVPDDTAVQVAAQTLAVGILGVGVPAASFIGAAVLGKLTK